MNLSRFALLIVAFFPIALMAQMEAFLLLEKPGTGNRIRYYVGDDIEFKRWDDKDFYKGQIVQLSDSSFFVDNMLEVKLREVEALADRSKVKAVHGFAKAAFIAIPTFFLFSAANNTFNTGDTPVVDEEVYPLAGIFAGIGALGLLYNGRRYRLKNKWRVIIVNH